MAKTDYEKFIDLTAELIIEVAERKAKEEAESQAQSKQSA